MDSRNVHRLHEEIVVAGWSCRVPGADSIQALWSLLLEGRCAIGRVPGDRFSLQRFWHPRQKERGKSYTWSAGILSDIWGFDPAVFGISPREAEQMDPQQRILLQLTWEALEDAGIPRSTLSGSDVGVFVGASSTEYGAAQYGDPAVADSHFATGNALAILANRISYIFDFCGPSLTVDTACSSSLVALHQAVEAIRSGRIDTAIVAGINIIASPYTFIGFSQASMLSPTGLCRAFDANADGFVRAEGGAVLVLRRFGLAHTNKNPIHGVILASDVNSDGRTNGISLPSSEAQEDLLNRVYSRAHIDPMRLAFIEAHGTGTPIGDPIEANAIGRSLGSGRTDPLAIGSVKTNIGHLEPASGIVGVLKALLALNHGVLPPSLHFTKPNPRIDFDGLNLTVCQRSLLLPNAASQCAGVNSFGFGGTNAHVILAAGRKPEGQQSHGKAGAARFLAISAETKPALVVLAQKYSGRLANLTDEQNSTIAGAAAYHRDELSHRLVVSSTESQKLVTALDTFAAGGAHPYLSVGTSLLHDVPTAFIYAGNGSQWVGMGTSAYSTNPAFRLQFDFVNREFQKLAGWCLKDAMFSDELGSRLDLSSVAQPLIFAIECAATEALHESGLQPSIVLGHSVGEIAAAEAAGILDIPSAVKVIFFRSQHQELTRGSGRMAAVMLPADQVARLASEVGEIEVAAINSPRSTTIAGSARAIAAFKVVADRNGIAMLDLGLNYPFHTALMAPVEEPLITDLEELVPNEAAIPFVSTVTGSCLPGLGLGAEHWWNNVRKPVLFSDAVREAAKFGARCFIEIGPRSTLLKQISECLNTEDGNFSAFSVFDRKSSESDPFDRAVANAIVNGARIDRHKVFGTDPGCIVQLPSYPWQQKAYRFVATPEAAIVIERERHPFAGAHDGDDLLEWHAHIDPVLVPELRDHRVGTRTLFPGTGFLEIALSVAREWLHSEIVTLTDVEILKPLEFGDETQEVMTRISPGSQTIEILSRPRLSRAGWILNCRTKALHSNNGRFISSPQFGDVQSLVLAPQLYREAEAVGLQYGPAFRLAREVRIDDHALIDVSLNPPTKPTPFILDPMRVDACIHGLFALLPGLEAQEKGVAHIPVRVEEMQLLVPYGVPYRATIEILRKSERSILANCFVLGAHDEVIAVLRGLRCQAVPVRRTLSIESVAFAQTLQPADGSLLDTSGVCVGTNDIIAAANELDLITEPAAVPSEASRTLEAWATTAAYELCSALSDENVLDPDALILGNRLPEELRFWFVNVLWKLEEIGLVQLKGSHWALVDEPSLPKSRDIAQSLVTDISSAASEILLVAEFSAFLDRVRTERALGASVQEILTPTTLDFHRVARGASMEAAELLGKVLRAKVFPAARSLRILQLGAGPLPQSLSEILLSGGFSLAILETDRWHLDHGLASLQNVSTVTILDPAATLPSKAYDLIIAAGGLSRLSGRFPISDLRKSLASNGLLVAIEFEPSLFRDFIFGVEPDWFSAGIDDFPVGLLRDPAEWEKTVRSAGFIDTETASVRCGKDLATLIVAEAGAQPSDVAVDAVAAANIQNTASTIEPGNNYEQDLALHLRHLLPSSAVNAQIASGNSNFASSGLATSEFIFHIVPAANSSSDDVEALCERCISLKSCLDQIGSTNTSLWLLFRGTVFAPKSNSPTMVDPVATGMWAFARTLSNEFPNLKVRCISIAPAISASAAAKRICQILESRTPETEFYLDEVETKVLRVVPARCLVQKNAKVTTEAANLTLQASSAQRVSWQSIDRTAPAPGEVEIAVEATGVNFRDLMSTMLLLPDDILEDGFSGPTLGLECAGTILRCGPSVRNLRPGDRVVAFAKSAFATHVTVPAGHVVKLPSSLICEAAATIPVAFLTAYYSLEVLARLQRGEWVLIHGGAGGVGMAAIQIAQARGARIIATAGSKAKRELLRMLGVENVLDSRSTSFVDGVREITGSGVDVVLNSIAGEGMERSVACLRSFGRFIELGKRDYVANTHLGLRPFRKNLSYFGVDIDQLIVGKSELGRKTFAKVMRLFAEGVLKPLPYAVFDAAEISDAFNLMKQSAHIGKIVVRPPKVETLRKPGQGFNIDREATHLVTGAFGGFGLETAKWLVSRGVRHLVLLGRQGPASAEAKAALASFVENGVKVLCEPCDVSDADALGKIFERIRKVMPPLAGVIHAAMVLEDSTINSLDLDRLRRTLVPKVKGADNLDRLTRGIPLDYFVLYSSITTLIGNPGQASYVAANGYMEGVARRRRQMGLPALAISWGPITDVGVIARSEKIRTGLEKMTAVWGMTSREALGLMAAALGQNSTDLDLAVLAVAPTAGPFDGERLALLRSPTYNWLTRNYGAQREKGIEKIDLRKLAEMHEIDAVRGIVTDAIVVELARVLHFHEDDINRTQPLGEIGLDSLMALELGMKLEAVFGIHFSLTGAAGNLSVTGLADEIIAKASADFVSHEDIAITPLAELHAKDVTPKEIETLREILGAEGLKAKG